jgi:microcystin-dependent protein
MSEAYIGEIRDFGFAYAPVNWVPCDGRSLPISEYSELFAVIGTIYGGDGVDNFAVPDLRGRIAIGSDEPQYSLGQMGGYEKIALDSWNLPPHAHDLMATHEEADTDAPQGGLLANTRSNTYAKPDSSPPLQMDTELDYASVAYSGSSKAFENRQPYLVTNFCIAYNGIFPPRS